MKKQLQITKLALLFAFAVGFSNLKSQCSASFTYSTGANGLVNFYSTSILSNSVTTLYTWNYGVAQFSATGNPGMNPSYTYTANGTYTVFLYISSSAPTCTSMTSAIVTVTNVGTGCNLVANFNASYGSNGLVNFNNTSTGTVSATSYTWLLGGGNISNSVNPSNSYTANGTYTVYLYASNNTSPQCASSKTLVVNINNICNLTNLAQTFTTNGNGSYTFTWTPSANAGNLSYYINWGNGNTGTGVVGNNSTFFQTQNYSNGTYTVTAVVTASAIPGCSAIVTQTISVSTVTCNLITNFTTSNGTNGLVNFNNTSSGTVSGTTYNWSFGDGGTSTSASPAHTYSANGAYIATLSANNNLSITCSGVMTKTVIVNNICTLNAGFTSSLSSNGLVMFSNTTSGTLGTTFYNWTFGDGGTSSAFNPSHTYANGTYTVKLTASTSTVLANCTSTFQNVINVTSNTCIANSNFSLAYSGTPHFWYAMPSNSLNIAAVQWSWGDGSTSNSLFTSHTYSVAGMYSICLSVTLNCGNSSMSCSSYSIYRSVGNTDEDMVTINVIEEGTVGLKEITSATNQKVSLYPNPTKGKFVVAIDGELKSETTISVYNLVGVKVYSNKVKNQNTEIDLNEISNGLYFVKIENLQGTSTSKILIQK